MDADTPKVQRENITYWWEEFKEEHNRLTPEEFRQLAENAYTSSAGLTMNTSAKQKVDDKNET